MPHWLHGFLVFTFAVHVIAFTILAVRRKKNYYFFLTGTFVCLTAIYILKFMSADPVIPAVGLPVIIALRVIAGVCTLTYLIVIARMPDSWLSRLIARATRRGAAG